MATLEKIRSKSVFLIVVIAVALLAFIIGDALTNSRNIFGDRTTVAKIGGEKIDYTEYQQKREELNNRLEQMKQTNPMAVQDYDGQMLAQMAIDQLITEKLIDSAVSRLGIRITGDQLRYYIFEQPVSGKMQDLVSALQHSGLNVSNPSEAYELIFNPKRNGLTDADVAPYQQAWKAMEEDTKLIIGRNIYERLLTSSVKANDLEKQMTYNDLNTTTQAVIAYQPFGQLDEKKYPVSDAEIKQLYEKEKNRFRVEEPTKTVGFIAVNITPSPADIQKSKNLANKVASVLRQSPTAQPDKELKKEGIVSTRRTARAQDLNGPLKDFVTTAPSDSVSVIMSNEQGFTVVRMGKHTAEVDSVWVNVVAAVGDKYPAQVVAALNGGLAVDSLSSRFPADSVMMQGKEQAIPLITAQGSTQAITDEQLAKLREAEGKYVILEQQPQGAVIAQLTKQSSPKEVYEFDEVKYVLNPSNTTIDDARTKLEKFLASNNTADKFMKNAAKAGYSVQDFDLSQSSPGIPNPASRTPYPESRQVVRWVMMDGDAGEVSHIYESKDANNPALYAVAIVAEYDDFIPMNTKKVKEYLTNKVRRSKAGDALVKQYSAQAGSMEQVSKAMNVEANEVGTLRFGRSANVRDSEVVGRMMGTKQGAKVYVVKGDNGVYAYRIDGVKAEKPEFNGKQLGEQYKQSLRINYEKMLRSGKKLKNNAYKFEGGD